MSPQNLNISPYPTDKAEQLAKIVGESSATAKALVELRRREANGENVGLFISGGFIFVGPKDNPLSQS